MLLLLMPPRSSCTPKLFHIPQTALRVLICKYTVLHVIKRVFLKKKIPKNHELQHQMMLRKLSMMSS
jgi:hypothetical protein